MRKRLFQPRGLLGAVLPEAALIVVAAAVVASVAYPAYMEQVRQSRRADATRVLGLTAERLERCFAECSAYTAQACAAPCPALPAMSPGGHYQVLAGTVRATSWTLVATPVAGSSQASDAACASFTLTSQGTKSATGSAAAKCWE